MRLHDCLTHAAGDLPDLPQAAIGADLGAPQAGRIPRHVGMVPRQPRQALSVRAEARGTHEVLPARKQPAFVGAILEADRHDGVDGLALAPVVLAHGQDPLTPAIELEVGVAQLPAALGRERPQSRGVVQPIHPLIGKVGEDDDAVAHAIGAAAVFVHARADVKG
jgi:hypothetical protein